MGSYFAFNKKIGGIMTWFELDKKKEGNKKVIYREYTIKSNYIKLDNYFKFGYDVYDSQLNPLIRFNTFDQAVKCVERLCK
jgi:hypothetical protein